MFTIIVYGPQERLKNGEGLRPIAARRVRQPAVAALLTELPSRLLEVG